jgi:hypothetical protein
MPKFQIGRAIALTATTEADEVWLDFLSNGDRKVLEHVEFTRSGSRHRLQVPTNGFAPGTYNIVVDATRGDLHKRVERTFDLT